jgi:hypothetical protein
MKNWFTKFLDEYFCSDNKMPEIPNPPAPTPELTEKQKQAEIEALPVSCFVLGIYKSIEENFEEWCYCYHNDKSFSYYNSYYNFFNKKNDLIIYFDKDGPYTTSSNYSFNEKEQLIIKNIINKMDKIKWEKLEKIRSEENTKKNKYFEELGCPAK